MSETNYQELREAAQQASQGEWIAYILPGENGTTYPVHTSEGRHCGFFMVWPGNDGLRNAGANARYIAAIPPKVALSLLDEIKRQEDSNIDAMCRIAELETNIAALVAENAGLKHAMAVTLEHVSVTDAGQAGVAAMIINDALHHSETPATDAFLAEVRASELDSLAGMAETMLVKFSNQQCSSDMHGVVGWKMVLQQASNRADQLRKGGNQ
ncbi:ead/Ea22-like family protein [Escherichia fergusonii]|uniref:ead/Ea22-like family protein n=1 Tax=Escherichia fergusonii TaxID=564 RepID=UPI002433798F|nr:ead/Ea22-like family protein [Escherichia fergusonii]WGA68596.1 ead/Ea22-like family protein [Escherichia fergusonii]